MDATEMTKTVKGMSEVVGAEITKLRHGVEVYGFNKTADWKTCKSALEALGFNCGPNCATWTEDGDSYAGGYTGTKEQFEAMVRGN